MSGPWTDRGRVGRLLCRLGFHRWAGYSIPVWPRQEARYTPLGRYIPRDGTTRVCQCEYRESYTSDDGWQAVSHYCG